MEVSSHLEENDLTPFNSHLILCTLLTRTRVQTLFFSPHRPLLPAATWPYQAVSWSRGITSSDPPPVPAMPGNRKTMGGASPPPCSLLWDVFHTTTAFHLPRDSGLPTMPADQINLPTTYFLPPTHTLPTTTFCAKTCRRGREGTGGDDVTLYDGGGQVSGVADVRQAGRVVSR